MSMPTLELIDVAKSFRGNWNWRTVRAVDGLSFALHDGEIFGLIGHNGAGKTTTFKILVGLLRPTRGAVMWRGRPLSWDQPRIGIGFSPEQPYFYDYLTVGETLSLYAQLYGMAATARRDRIAQLLDEFRIAHKVNAPMRTLSKGTLQRVAVAQAILHRPRLAILDEPMSGLDPAGRKHMRELIAALKCQGTTVLFSSHILSDAEALCDRVGILADGKLRDVITLDRQGVDPTGYTLVVDQAGGEVVEVLARLALQPPAGGPRRWTVRLKDQATAQSALLHLHRAEAIVESLVPEYPSLEQRFLRYTDNGVAND